MENEFYFVSDLLPENSIPMASLRLVYFLSEEGKPKYRFLWEGEGASTDIIGILEVIKSELVSQAYNLGGGNDK